jgi:hypothetical protein
VRFRLQQPLVAAHDRKKSNGLFWGSPQVSGVGHIGRQLAEVFIEKSSKSGAMR